MNSIPHGPLSTANFVQGFSKQVNNEKLAFVLTGLSVVLVGKLVFDQFFEKNQRQVLDHERRFHSGHGR